MPYTVYDWRVRGRTLMQMDILNPPVRQDVTLVGDHQERIATFKYLYRNGYLTGTALCDARAIFAQETTA